MHQANEPIDRLLTKRQAAAVFQVSTRTIDRWRSLNLDLGSVKIRHTVRFSQAKIQKLLNSPKRRPLI
jgi:hypothetical protein